jgi:hypothetical protein
MNCLVLSLRYRFFITLQSTSLTTDIVIIQVGQYHYAFAFMDIGGSRYGGRDYGCTYCEPD